MKIMSFNTQHCVNYIEQRVDYDIIAKAIMDCGADIVGLNEMYDEGSIFGRQTEKLSQLTGLENHYFGYAIDIPGEGPYGNGFLSRYKILNAETILIPDPSPRKYKGYYETRCILKIKLENGLTVMVVHFGLNPDEHENAVRTIVENLEPKKCVLMGDFNVEPSNPVLKPIYEKMCDTEHLYPCPRKSWPSDKPKMIIDYIFTTPDIEQVSADIPELIASDHRPHLAEIKF